MCRDKERAEKPKVIIEIRIDGQLLEFPEGKEVPVEVKAKEVLDKKKREAIAKKAAEKKKNREEKKAKAKK